jgi:hypothetical protein
MIVLSLIFVSTTVFAKNIQKNTWEIAASSNLTYSYTDLKINSLDTSEKIKSFNLAVSPIMYVIENFGIGLILEGNYTEIGSSKETIYGIGALQRCL